MASASPDTAQTVIMKQTDKKSSTMLIALQKDQKPFQCGYCSVTFDINISLVHHIQQHSFTKPFQCGYCKVSYNTNPELKLHIRTHALFISLPPKAMGVGESHPLPPTYQHDQNKNSTTSYTDRLQGTCVTRISSFVSSHLQIQSTKIPAAVGGSTDHPTNSGATDQDHIMDLEDTSDNTIGHSVESEDESRDCPQRLQNGFESDQLASPASTWRNPHPHAKPISKEAQSPNRVISNIGLEMMETSFNDQEKIKSGHATEEKGADSEMFDVTTVKTEQEHDDLNDHSASQNKIHDDAAAVSFSNKSVCDGNGMQSTHSQLQHCKKLALKDRGRTGRPHQHFQCNICGASFKAWRYVGDHKRRVHKVKSGKDRGDIGDPSLHSPFIQTSQQSNLPQESSHTHSSQHAFVSKVRLSDFQCQENVIQLEPQHPDGLLVVCETKGQNPSLSEPQTSELTNTLTDASDNERSSGGILLDVMLPASNQTAQNLNAVANKKCFVCSLCGKVLKTKETLKKHKSNVHSDHRPFPCLQCPSRFKVKQALLDHVSFVHKDERRFLCSHCSARYKTKVQLSIHVRSKHSDERPFQCAQCSARFKQKGHLSEHMFNVHNGERRFPCAQCSLRFKRKIQLTTHIASVHHNQRPFACLHCTTRFKSKGELSNHVNRVHNSERPHQCADCGKCFKVKADLSQHWCKPRECPVCGRLLSCPSTFASHLRTHSEEKAVQCSLCNKAFRTQRLLEIHTRTHTKEKPYTCEFCGQSFTLVNTFTYHRNRHLDTRPYSCDICEKRFNSHQGLWQHKCRHLGDKRYPCDLCEKMFYNSSSLKQHALTHTDLRPLSCSVCGKTYRCRSTLKYHLKHFHQL